jgi:succinate-acetate transporter protein
MVKKKEVKKGFFSRTRRFNIWDIGLTKWSVFFFTLFIVSLLSTKYLIKTIELRWLWVVLFILLAIKPIIKFFRK